MATSVHVDRHVALADSAGNAIDTGNPLPTTGGGGGGSGAAQADKSSFIEGTSLATPIMGFYNEILGADPVEDSGVAFRATVKRALHTNLRDAAGNELGIATSPLRIDPTGTTTQPVTGTVAANQGGTWNVGVTGTVTVAGTVGISGIVTVSGTVSVSGTVTVSQQNLATADYDTGAGTTTQAMIGIALPASGGPVAGGTLTNPLRVDPTGTTTQPVTGTVTANQGGAWTVTANQGGAWSVTVSGSVTVAGGKSNNAGAPGATNLGVLPALANAAAPTWNDGNQVLLSTDLAGNLRVGGTVSVSGTVSVTGTVTANQGGTWTVAQGTAAAGSGAWPVTVTDTSNVLVKPGDAANSAVRVNIVAGSVGSGQADNSTFTEGTTNFTAIGGEYNTGATAATSGRAAACQITQFRGLHTNLRNAAGTEIGTASNPVRTDPTGSTPQPVSGTVAISGTVTVSGTVTADQGAPNSAANAWPVKVTDGVNTTAVKAAAAAAVAADPSAVVALSPNSPLPAGTNAIGSVGQSGAPWTQRIQDGTSTALVAVTLANELRVLDKDVRRLLEEILIELRLARGIEP